MAVKPEEYKVVTDTLQGFTQQRFMEFVAEHEKLQDGTLGGSVGFDATTGELLIETQFKLEAPVGEYLTKLSTLREKYTPKVVEKVVESVEEPGLFTRALNTVRGWFGF